MVQFLLPFPCGVSGTVVLPMTVDFGSVVLRFISLVAIDALGASYHAMPFASF